MKEYEIIWLSNDNYTCFFVMLVTDSILNYIDEIHVRELNHLKSGKILIDQLLATGNSKNRYIECEVLNGKIMLSTAENTTVNQQYKLYTRDTIINNRVTLSNTMLTNHQIESLKAGIAL